MGRDNKYIDQFEQNKCCLIIPTFNNAKFLEECINRAEDFCNDILVVNDGSTDHTKQILKKFESVRTLSFAKNRGKGSALKAGFKWALELGYDHAITMDSDNQHRPEDIPAFLQILDNDPGALVIGSRILDQENVPGKNKIANRLSSFWYRVETGLKIQDTQSGFRLYPIRNLKGIRLFSGKYEFELEVLVKAAWKGIPIKDIPIDVLYPPAKERISHFRPFTDFLRISLLNILLVFLGLAFFRPRLVFQKYRNKSLRQIFREDIVSSDTPRHVIALSIAFGIFMGILPIWGYQLVIGFFFAHLLKINKPIFFIAANISIPPMIPFVLYLSYVTGSYVLGEGSWKVDMELNLGSIGQNLKQYLTGAVVFATIAGIVSAIISYGILILFKRNR